MFELDATGTPVAVEDLDPAALLRVLEQRKLGARAEERGKLRLAGQWCVLHPATADTGVATWAGDALPGVLNTDESLGGEGTPAVSAFAPEPVAAALGVSTLTGMKLIADALDLQHRLPRIWRLVEDLAVEPWKARQVAQATHTLSREAAAYVDDQLAPRLASCGFTAIQTAVAMAIAKYHPELLEQREKQGRKGWHVTLRHPAPGDYDGTSYLDVAGDTLDLTAFHDLVCDQAAAAQGARRHRRPRDPQGQGPRRHRRPAGHPRPGHPDRRRRPGGRAGRDRPGAPAADRALRARLPHRPAPPRPRRRRGRGRRGGEARPRHRGEDPRLAAAAPTTWSSARCSTSTGAPPWTGTTRPRRSARSSSSATATASSPGAPSTPAHTDLDHIDPYVPMDEGGPPGQTNPHNLACLCRRHHRCKTSGRWRYRRRDDGTYEWHGPHGRSYLVTPLGTLEIPTN